MMRGGKINFGWGGGADGDVSVPGGRFPTFLIRLSFEGIGIL
jgi:hypothetical protein